MKGKKEQKGSNKKSSSSPLDEIEKKRRSSLTDTPITSSSSSEGMASTDSQPCSSKQTMRKKRKSQKKAVQASNNSSNSPPSHERLETKFSNLPVYTKANSSTTNTVSLAHPRCSSSIQSNYSPVTSCNVDFVFNKNVPDVSPLMTSIQNNKWLKTMKDALIEGDHSVFLCGVRYMCVILCRNNDCFKGYTKQKLVQHVIEALVSSYYDSEYQKTIFMDLCSTRTKRCSEMGHSFCRLARTLLENLSKESVSRILSVVTKTQYRTALHFATMTGDLCQVRVLLEYDIDVDAQDQQYQTPLYYALKNKNLEMVKLLLWYGADFSYRTSYERKLYLHARAFDEQIVAPWFEQRINALSKKFYQYISELCRNAIMFRSEDALSDMHVLRCSYNMDAESDVSYDQKTKNWLARSINININHSFESDKDNVAVLFIMPFCYSPQDQGSPADIPCIYRTSLLVKHGSQNTRPLQLFPTKPLIQTPEDRKVFELEPAIQQIHNGFIYCYLMPDKLQNKLYTFSANIELEGLSSRQKRTTLLGIQVFKISNKQINNKKFN